jgi:protein required for attachment to host cells
MAPRAFQNPACVALCCVTTVASPGNDDEVANRFKEEPPLATPNYSFEKRQRELAKKRKAEEKRQRKQSSSPADDSPGQGAQASAPSAAGSAPNDPGAKPAP